MDSTFTTEKFRVFQLYVEIRHLEEVFSLGGDAIFLGFNSAVSVSRAVAEGSGFQANCIYFTDDVFSEISDEVVGNGGFGMYNVEDGSIDRFSDNEYRSILSCIKQPREPNIGLLNAFTTRSINQFFFSCC
ncbi:OLC1v1009960C1 [Oldenlandia corymbosa var. corymbosa]|uniref:OLC1v1009960C1 n=1 Tax=Oldenlandia corymbosa var. corymbosa TaxID=529605 RepID=A0AAV1DQ59_OLDCO|nr:OLC1v1009960C1 [Oldenlandia corymbosa var. corymbosa]